MAANPVPLVILGGGDRRPVRLPAEGRGKHPLTGYKGLDLRIGGRRLIELVLERMRACGSFDPIFVAGPAEAYRAAGLEARLIDTNSSFGVNIGAALEAASAARPGSAIAFTTCDILPEARDLDAAMREFRQGEPYDLWFPLVRVPADRSLLGASAWKPRYRFREAPGREQVEILPSHLIVVDPEALRLDFVFRLMGAGYRCRNRSVLYRLALLFGTFLATIVAHDLGRIVRGRRPTRVRDILLSGSAGAMRLGRGNAPVAEIEDAVRGIFVRREHRDRYPERRVRMPFVDGLSLALDIDTEEEAREVEESFGSRMHG